LHQAAQHTCMAVLRVFTGYRSTTHNLSRLLALIENITFNLTIIFPCFTKDETDLFNLLNKAYSNARYNDNFKVPIEKAQTLTDRVKELLTIAEQLYQIKITALENNQTITFPLVIENEKEKAL
jgi:HEPN domain-containing protein